MASSIKPFKISVPESALNSLQAKLENTILPDDNPLADNWDYGTPLSDVKRLVKYWSNGFDWRAQEKKLNELPQFTTNINVDDFGDLDIHFVHQKSSREGSIPLLFCHGWPGSFIEITKILPLLTDGKADGPSFHVVAPSLPNFGFSQAVAKPGFSIAKYAETVHKLMLKLGYNKYVTQGGDWGWPITRTVGIKYPHCVASLYNYITLDKVGLGNWLATRDTPLTEQEKAGLARGEWFYEHGAAYNAIQSTRPSTLGFALRDSPTAVLSWIYEKLHDWTDSYPWTDDEILTWVSIYQFSRGGPEASVRIYYERMHGDPESRKELYKYNDGVKIGYSAFPKDLSVLPTAFAHTLGPVAYEVGHPDGGHFASYERPELLAGDLKKMFGEGGGAHDVGKSIGV